MGLELTVLGCDGSYSGPGGACSGYLLSLDDVHVWVDCGPGTLSNVQQHVSLDDITAIVISHVHPDHWIELPVTHNALRYFFHRRNVPLFATLETLTRFDALQGAGVADTFRPHVIADGSHFDIDGVAFRASRTDHPVETLALRVDAGGRSLTYSADTGGGWSLEALGEVDVALCEATLRPDQAGLVPHLTTTQAGASARAAGAGRLIITHLPPGADAPAHQAEAADAFGAEVEVATTNTRFTI